MPPCDRLTRNWRKVWAKWNLICQARQRQAIHKQQLLFAQWAFPRMQLPAGVRGKVHADLDTQIRISPRRQPRPWFAARICHSASATQNLSRPRARLARPRAFHPTPSPAQPWPWAIPCCPPITAVRWVCAADAQDSLPSKPAIWGCPRAFALTVLGRAKRTPATADSVQRPTVQRTEPRLGRAPKWLNLAEWHPAYEHWLWSYDSENTVTETCKPTATKYQI